VASDAIAIVEAGYELEPTSDAWLARVLDAIAPQLFGPSAGFACFYDRDAPHVVRSFVDRGADPRIIRAGVTAHRDSALRGAPIVRLSFGTVDVVFVRADCCDGVGALFGGVVRRRRRDARDDAAWWSPVIAHVAAGLRLRRAVGRGGMRRAAFAIDRARGSLQRRDVGAVDAWDALVDGRWSLVDQFDTDGKRFVVALPNATIARDPRALSAIERAIAERVALGNTNKLVAYELSIPTGTVATRVAAIARKLGVRSRVEIVDRVQLLRRATFVTAELAATNIVIGTAPIRSREARLTVAEREVCELAARGTSNADIANARGSAARTVANLLASAYRKLGVASRAQLVRVLHDPETK
jgi:DNA-binding NarL/FixJ family response regulator